VKMRMFNIRYSIGWYEFSGGRYSERVETALRLRVKHDDPETASGSNFILNLC